MSSESTTKILRNVTGRKAALTAYDIVKRWTTDKTTIGDLAEEKNPAINFDLLSPEDRAKAEEKLTAFKNIVKPEQYSANQKQEHDSFKSEDQEFRFWYDQYLPNIGTPGYAESK